jgi:hypothetical protein
MNMKRMMMAMVLGLLSAASAQAGYYTQTELVLPNPMTGKPLKATIELWREGDMLKQTAPIGGQVVIIDIKKRETIGLDTAKKEYWKMPFDRYQKLAQNQLVGLGIVPDVNGKYTVPDRLFERTGQTALIEGREAYEVRAKSQIKLPPQMVQPGRPSSIDTVISVWLSTKLPMGTKDRVSEMRMQFADPKTPEFAALLAQLEVFAGYPVQTTSTVKTPNGEVQSSTTMLQYRELKVPDAEFAVPQGYTLVDDPMLQLERAMQKPVGVNAPLQ